MTKEIYIEKNGYIATLVINRPEKRNSLSRAMFQAILNELYYLSSDPSIKLLIVRGVNEVAFSSGLILVSF